MIVVAWMLLQAAAVADKAPAAPVAPRPDWVSKPNLMDAMHCLRPLGGSAPEAVVTLRCVTAPHDQIKDCVVVSNTRAPDARYERAALCSTKYFRIRAPGADGPVMGVPVNVPFGVVSQATLMAMAKAGRAGRLPAPAEGAVD